MSDYIPDELWPDILHKTAPETLLRCRCVCKSWRSFISSPSFIASHLASQKPRLIFRESPKLRHQIEDERYVLFRPKSLPSFDLRFSADPHPSLHIIGTANGVICLADEFLSMINTIVLWNPLIRRCLYPPPPIYSSPNVEYTSTLGFGLDPSTNDLKIVKISRVIRGGLFGRRGHFPPKAEVFSVREWKWKSTDFDNMQDVYTFQNRWSQCSLNGAAHWAAYVRSTRVVLLSFRFETEEFRVMELPLELRGTQVSVSKIGADLLSVVNYTRSACDIWAMQVYGEASSWCKMVSVSWEGGGLRNVMWVRGDCGEVIVSAEGEEVLCYDTLNQKGELIGIRCKGDGYFADGFVGSLVLMDVEDWDDKGKWLDPKHEL